MRKDPYQKLLDRKRKWSPVQTTAGKLREGSEETILRALAIRHMELPVGDWIKEALKREVPPYARELLASNVEDEENHDLALGYIANAHNVDPESTVEKEAIKLTVLIQNLKPNKKPLSSEKLGLRILITQSSKHWWPNVHFSSFYYPFLGLMVTLDCEQ